LRRFPRSKIPGPWIGNKWAPAATSAAGPAAGLVFCHLANGPLGARLYL
jgi:hypothetical protein